MEGLSLGCQSVSRKCEIESISFAMILYTFCLECKFYDVVLRVSVIKYGKLEAPGPVTSAYEKLREHLSETLIGEL